MNFLENSLSIPIYHLINVWQKQILTNTHYLGIPTLKNPLDFWIYQEIIHEIKPDIIIEIGNYMGGSTLALAHTLDNLELHDSKILALDINHSLIDSKVLNHKKIHLITGNALESLGEVREHIKDTDKVLIIEDSSHMYSDTLEILKLYSPLVTLGSYFIVEDGIVVINKNNSYNDGPYRAVNEFVSENKFFQIDRTKEKFIMTWNPKGFLKKIK